MILVNKNYVVMDEMLFGNYSHLFDVKNVGNYNITSSFALDLLREMYDLILNSSIGSFHYRYL
jgi:hypothetical protein